MTGAVTVALRERLQRERMTRAVGPDLPAWIKAFSERVKGNYDTRPVTRAEWDWAGGDGG